jgi:predicted kinase
VDKRGTLKFFCGKMGAGKSTKSQQIARELDAILLSEDDWLATIYPEEIRNFGDYIKFSSRLKPLLLDHVRSILNAGISVVMDFPANTTSQRKWFKEVLSNSGIPHKLIFLDVDDHLCLEQIKRRRETHPERAQFDTEEVFYQVTSYFERPSEEEGFEIEIVRREHA